ncbi:MAG: hypothetical protein KIB40_21670, partial [Pantoea sp.]|uniref:hypothetical protein n=1 Tax=Pantoea sp. TaxID=69393 RepID=UPI00257D186D
DDKGRNAGKRAYCLKICPATGTLAPNLIYSTKPSLTAKPQIHLKSDTVPARRAGTVSLLDGCFNYAFDIAERYEACGHFLSSPTV